MNLKVIIPAALLFLHIHLPVASHPSLFMDAERILQLRQASHTTHTVLWNEIKSQAVSALKLYSPQYQADGRNR